ncbi:MAG TPA: hypothetical protein VKE92_10115 [Anaerolineales bacterium]|nr:hypothetical protein [Anaerolineales bacterium]
MIVKLSDPMMLQFFKRQSAIAREQLDGLDLDNPRDLAAYKELRLLSRLWTDLETFAKDWADGNDGETSQDGE